jgi:hypothetical protein
MGLADGPDQGFVIKRELPMIRGAGPKLGYRGEVLGDGRIRTLAEKVVPHRGPVREASGELLDESGQGFADSSPPCRADANVHGQETFDPVRCQGTEG